MSSIPETTYFVFAEKEIDKKTKMYKQVKKRKHRGISASE